MVAEKARMTMMSVPIPTQNISDLFINGIELSIGYWCREVRIVRADGTRVAGLGRLPSDILGHCKITFVEDDEDESEHVLDLTTWDEHSAGYAAIEQGLQKMPAQHLASILSGDDDAITADVFIQCCLFGEVRYG